MSKILVPLKMLRGFFIIKYIKNQIKNIPKKYIKKTKYSENSVDIKKSPCYYKDTPKEIKFKET